MRTSLADLRNRAFTLVEMAVVVLVIGVLVLLLLPSLAQSRAAARLAWCASNQRQLHVAMMGAPAAGETVMPTAYQWVGRVVSNRADEALVCPEDDGPGVGEGAEGGVIPAIEGVYFHQFGNDGVDYFVYLSDLLDAPGDLPADEQLSVYYKDEGHILDLGNVSDDSGDGLTAAGVPLQYAGVTGSYLNNVKKDLWPDETAAIAAMAGMVPDELALVWMGAGVHISMEIDPEGVTVKTYPMPVDFYVCRGGWNPLTPHTPVWHYAWMGGGSRHWLRQDDGSSLESGEMLATLGGRGYKFASPPQPEKNDYQGWYHGDVVTLRFGAESTDSGTGLASYGMNNQAPARRPEQGQILLVDYEKTVVDVDGEGTFDDDFDLMFAPRHLGGFANSLMGDGSVNQYRRDQLDPLMGTDRDLWAVD